MRVSSESRPIHLPRPKGDPRGRPSRFRRVRLPGSWLAPVSIPVSASVPLRLTVLLLAVLLTGCGPVQPVSGPSTPNASPAVHSGPVVLVTFSNLRADAVGYLGGAGTTQNFDSLARRAEFAGSAVAASTSPPVSAASLIVGTRPWQHQLLSHQAGRLRADLPTLGEALGARGYESVIHYEVRQRMHVWGFFRGFDSAVDLEAGLQAATKELSQLDGGPELLWIHLRTADLPWHGRGESIGLADLYPYADPSRALPESVRDRARRLYLDAVGRADRDLGKILRAIEASGRRNETLLAVTALHGMEFGEHDQTLYGHNLGRESIQVPLLVDLPGAWSTVPLADHDRAEVPVRRTPVELIRLWPTLVQVAGGQRLPLHPPSLFEPAAGPALSALYLENGVNFHTAVFANGAVADGGASLPEQILVTSRFAPAEPLFHLARLAEASLPAPGLSQSPRSLFDRLRRQFIDAPPWSTFDSMTGESTVTLTLERWRRVRGTDVVDDQDLARRRAGEAYAAWRRWVGPETPPRHTD